MKKSHYSSNLKSDSVAINNTEYLVPGIPLQWHPKRHKMIFVCLEACANNITQIHSVNDKSKGKLKAACYFITVFSIP